MMTSQPRPGILTWLQSLAAAPASTADWEALYREYLPKIYNFFRYRVGDGPLAEDLTALTFEKAWRARERYRRDLAAFSTWLFTIARNVATDHFRRERALVELDAGPEDGAAAGHGEGGLHAQARGLEEVVERRAESARLALLLASLPEREQELIALKYGAGLTNRAIAQLTGLSESNVGTIVHRVVAGLRAEWDRPVPRPAQEGQGR